VLKKLRKNPNDVVAREKFAILLAEQLDKVDLAIEQLELLLAMPDPPEQKAAEWLALVAAWRMKYQQNWDAARLTLKRLIQLYRKLLKPSRRSVASVWWRSNSAFAKPYRKIDPPSLRRHDDVIPLAFAQEQMFAVKQLFPGDTLLNIYFPDVVYVYSASLNVFARLAF